MDKKEEFKSFIKNKEFLIDKVNKGETTWQKLYEIYDLYGESASIFKDVKKEEDVKDNKANSLLKAFEDIDVNKINENLEGVRKILAVLGEFTKKDDSKAKRVYSRPTSNYND